MRGAGIKKAERIQIFIKHNGGCPDSAKNLIKMILDEDPSKRPNIKEIGDHPYLSHPLDSQETDRSEIMASRLAEMTEKLTSTKKKAQPSLVSSNKKNSFKGGQAFGNGAEKSAKLSEILNNIKK